MRRVSFPALFFFLFLLTPAEILLADEPAPRASWVLDESYQGPHRDSFQRLRFEVPILMRQTLINLSGRLGMNFQEGWLYPVTVGFVDTTPFGRENTLAYVSLLSDGERIFQHLHINLTAYEREAFNFDKVFAHELVHAMLNDAIGAEAAVVLPVWFHEGLAIYGAEQGEQMLNAYLKTHADLSVEEFINGLEGPHGPLDYVEDYLAFKYIYKEHGINALHYFVRDVIRRKGDIAGAIDVTCGESWEGFKKNAAAFSEEEIEQQRRRMRGGTEKPY